MAMMAPILRWSDSFGLKVTSAVATLQSHLPSPLNDISPDLLLAILTSFTFIIVFSIASIALKKTPGSTKAIHIGSSIGIKKQRAKETPKVVLIGPSNSGKTSLFSALAFNSVPSAHPSQHGSESAISLSAAPKNELKEAQKRNILLVDTPGHSRIKDRIIAESIKDVDVIAFCIDAKDALRGGISAGQAKDSTITEAVDHLHAALTQLVKVRKVEKSRPPNLLFLLTRSDLSPHLNNVSVSSTSEEDLKRRSILLSRAQTTVEMELSKRRAGMGLKAKKSAKVGGMTKVQGGRSSDGIWVTIKSLLGLRSTTTKGEDDDDDDDDDEVVDYVADTSATHNELSSSQISLNKLNTSIIYGGRAEFVFASLGKERGWTERDFEGLNQLKQILVDV